MYTKFKYGDCVKLNLKDGFYTSFPTGIIRSYRTKFKEVGILRVCSVPDGIEYQVQFPHTNQWIPEHDLALISEVI